MTRPLPLRRQELGAAARAGWWYVATALHFICARYAVVYVDTKIGTPHGARGILAAGLTRLEARTIATRAFARGDTPGVVIRSMLTGRVHAFQTGRVRRRQLGAGSTTPA